MVKAEDGDEVDSELERRVDNALYLANLTHKVHPSIHHGSKYKADFKVGDVFVEVWGIEGDEEYTKRMQEKLNYYTAKGLTNRLVEIKPEDCKSVRRLVKKVDEIKSKMREKPRTISSKKGQKLIQPELNYWSLAETFAKDELKDVDTKIQMREDRKKELESTYKTRIKEIDSEINKLKDERRTIIEKYNN